MSLHLFECLCCVSKIYRNKLKPNSEAYLDFVLCEVQLSAASLGTNVDIIGGVEIASNFIR